MIRVMYLYIFEGEYWFAMIINSNDILQRNILTNKCFYQTTAQIMHDFEQKGYANSADENNYSKDYNEAFGKIDSAIKSMANKVFYTYDKQSFDYAYRSFQNFDYINAIIGRQRLKKNSF